MKKILLIFGFLVLLFVVTIVVNRNSGVYIDDLPHKIINFSELPTLVKEKYVLEMNNPNDRKSKCYCLDCSDSCKVILNAMDKNLFKLIWNGFVYEIFINDYVYKLKANKGKPFIVYKKKFFYPTSFNLNKTTYLNANYYSVDLDR